MDHSASRGRSGSGAGVEIVDLLLLERLSFGAAGWFNLSYVAFGKAGLWSGTKFAGASSKSNGGSALDASPVNVEYS